MSNDRLRVKLMAAGYEEDVVLGYERDDLMSLYADVLARKLLGQIFSQLIHTTQHKPQSWKR